MKMHRSSQEGNAKIRDRERETERELLEMEIGTKTAPFGCTASL